MRHVEVNAKPAQRFAAPHGPAYHGGAWPGLNEQRPARSSRAGPASERYLDRVTTSVRIMAPMKDVLNHPGVRSGVGMTSASPTVRRLPPTHAAYARPLDRHRPWMNSTSMWPSDGPITPLTGADAP